MTSRARLAPWSKRPCETSRCKLLCIMIVFKLWLGVALQDCQPGSSCWGGRLTRGGCSGSRTRMSRPHSAAGRPPYFRSCAAPCLGRPAAAHPPFLSQDECPLTAKGERLPSQGFVKGFCGGVRICRHFWPEKHQPDSKRLSRSCLECHDNCLQKSP